MVGETELSPCSKEWVRQRAEKGGHIDARRDRANVMRGVEGGQHWC